VLDLAVHSQVTPTPSTTLALVASRDRTTSSAPSSTPAAARSTATSSWTSTPSERRPRRPHHPCFPSSSAACSNRRASSLPADLRKTWHPAALAQWAATRSPWSRHRTGASACVASCRMPGMTTRPRSSTQATTRSSSMRAPMVPKRRPRFARRKAWKTHGSPLILGRRLHSTPSPLDSTRIPCRHRHHPCHNRHRPPRRPPRHHQIHRRHRRSRCRPLRPVAFPQKERPRAGTCSSNEQTTGSAKMAEREANRHCACLEPIGPIARYAVTRRRRRPVHPHHHRRRLRHRPRRRHPFRRLHRRRRPARRRLRHRRRRHRHTSTISSSAVHTSSGVPEKPL